MRMDTIQKYFPGLTSIQQEQLSALKPLYYHWNSQINVISRKDFEHFYLHHVLHSLAIAKFLHFKPGTKIIDVGTGGGFPGIPLAIFFPESSFTLLDSVGKKIKVVNEVKKELDINNATGVQSRSEDYKGKFDFIVSRAVTKLPGFVKLTRHLIAKQPQNAIPNGILYLKGGDIQEETAPFQKTVFVQDLNEWFEEPFFETKKLVHLPL